MERGGGINASAEVLGVGGNRQHVSAAAQNSRSYTTALLW
jgi:hypothetical protein